MPLAVASHLVNVVVLVMVLRGLWAEAPAMGAAYGPDTPARRILACVYGAILLGSAAALAGAAVTRLDGGAAATFAWFSLSLFAVQIVYKLATALAVGPGNPVVIANLAIAAFHAASVVALVLALRRGLGPSLA